MEAARGQDGSLAEAQQRELQQLAREQGQLAELVLRLSEPTGQEDNGGAGTSPDVYDENDRDTPTEETLDGVLLPERWE